jgi:hypothetical protein
MDEKLARNRVRYGTAQHSQVGWLVGMIDEAKPGVVDQTDAAARFRDRVYYRLRE